MAWYNNGTVSVTNGSNVVNAAGAQWVINGIQAGWGLIVGDLAPREILSVNSDNSLTLRSPWTGPTLSGQPYAIMPTSSLAGDLAVGVGNLIAGFVAVRDGPGAGKFPDGTGVAPSVTFANDQDTGIYRADNNILGLTAGGAASFVSPQGISFNAADGKGAGFLIATERFFPAGGVSIARFGISYNPYIGQGSVGMSAFGALHFFTNDALRWSIVQAGHLAPAVDNTMAVGGINNRVSVIYAASGTINTSDEREKEWRGALTPAELAAAREISKEIGIYRWLDAIAEKGQAARLHCGVRAQRVIAALEAQGLDPMRYGFICYDEWKATVGGKDKDGFVTAPSGRAGDRYGIRPDELLFFLLAAQEQRLAALEA
jgi:hypothetical protein